MKRVVIDIGHRAAAPGACSVKFKICEFKFNSEVADKLKEMLDKNNICETVVTSRDANTDSQTLLANKINALNGHFVVSLHCNAATPQAQGTEMLYANSSARSKMFAEIFQKYVLQAYRFRDRKALARKKTDRGGALLHLVKAPIVLTEPFFLSNDTETEKVLNDKDLLVNAYYKSIVEILELLK
jgi:N-acetylmuramoyl-L-alanine amidase